MADLKTKERELTTAEIETFGILPKQPDGPKLVKAQEPETLGRAAAVSEPIIATFVKHVTQQPD